MLLISFRSREVSWSRCPSSPPTLSPLGSGLSKWRFREPPLPGGIAYVINLDGGERKKGRANWLPPTSTNSNFQAQLHCAGLLLSPKLYAPPQPGQVLPVGEPVLVLLQMLGLLVHLQGHLLPQPALLSDSTMELTLSGPQVSVPSVAHHVMSLWFCLSCETC